MSNEAERIAQSLELIAHELAHSGRSREAMTILEAAEWITDTKRRTRMGADSAAAFVRGDVRQEHAERAEGPAVSGPQRTRTPEDIEYATRWGGEFGQIALDGNYEALKSAWQRSQAARRQQEHGSVADIPLPIVPGFSVRDCNTLEKEHSIRTVSQYMDADTGYLEATPQLGPLSVRNLERSIRKFLYALVLESEGKAR